MKVGAILTLMIGLYRYSYAVGSTIHPTSDFARSTLRSILTYEGSPTTGAP